VPEKLISIAVGLNVGAVSGPVNSSYGSVMGLAGSDGAQVSRVHDVDNAVVRSNSNLGAVRTGGADLDPPGSDLLGAVNFSV
jgi:hypothetical protein